MSETEAAVLGAVDGEFLERTLAELVSIPSLSAEEHEAQRHVARILRDLGAVVDEFELDVEAMERHPYHSTEFERPDALGVVGHVGQGDGPSLLMMGHVDVVPTGDPERWTTPPFTPAVRDGRMFGRGTCDTKGGVAAALTAMKALVDAGVDLPGSVAFSSVVGEEDGGSGALGTLLHGVTADGVVILEPTRLAVSPATAGALSFTISLVGQAAHGCLREEGVSAIEHLRPVHDALLRLEAERNRRGAHPLFEWLERPFAICVGRLEAGDWASTEADWLRLEGRYGVSPGEDLVAARTQFEDAIRQGVADDPWLVAHPPEVAWIGGQFHPAATPLDDPIVTIVEGVAGEILTGPVEVVGQPYGCDLGITGNVGGIPGIIFGPGDVRDAHAPDESVDLADVRRAAEVLALSALRFTRGDGR